MGVVKCIVCGKRYIENIEICPSCSYPAAQSIKEHNLEKYSSGDEIEEANNKRVDRYRIKAKEGVINRSKLPKQKSEFVIVFLIFFFLLLGIVSLFSFKSVYVEDKTEKAMELVSATIHEDYDDTIENQIYSWIESDELIREVYGWEFAKIEDDMFFAAFGFDYDYDKSNGYIFYCYEINTEYETVEMISGNEKLEEKYRVLDFIE